MKRNLRSSARIAQAKQTRARAPSPAAKGTKASGSRRPPKRQRKDEKEPSPSPEDGPSTEAKANPSPPANGDKAGGARRPPKRRRKAEKEPSPQAEDGPSTEAKASASSAAPQPDLPAAVGLLATVGRAHKYLSSIGTCPSKYYETQKQMRSYSNIPEDEGIAAQKKYRRLPRTDTRDDHADMNATDGQLDDETWNSNLVDELAAIREARMRDYATGQLKPFELRITRPGCTFNGIIVPIDARRQTTEEREVTEKKLKAWYDKADVSGFGDAQEQVTRYDEKIRNAREIPASQFSVPPTLIEQIRECWDSRFPANAGVHIEPYKIHLYGPGGHFKMHRDTPQTDLVGTFLVGLGDTVSDRYWGSSNKEGLRILNQPVSSHEGECIQALPRQRGRCAVPTLDEPPDEQVMDVLSKMRAPYGLLMEHRYAYGTSKFSGFDVCLLQCVRSLPGVVVRDLPVIVEAFSEWGGPDGEDFNSTCTTSVYPMTSGHVEALMTVGDAEYGRISHAECGCDWLEEVKKVPFFGVDLRMAAMLIKDEEAETVNYVGNEAEAWRRDSVYFSYAVVVLPAPVEEAPEPTGKGKGKKKAAPAGNSGEKKTTT
ncbi:hypothetical protein BD413DRAFT_615801 [Trametes elegans]|nr:hypothetical protein BD413DRAFT_615801 [Trametes elegans]